MATGKKELHVDELLGSYEVPSNKSKETKVAKRSDNDWAEEEEENYAFGIAKDQQAATKKAQKKKGAGKGWADVEAAQQAQPKTQDFAKIQEEEQKRKIIKKPGQGRPTAGVDIGSEAFPSLGEAPTKPAPKKTEPTPVVAPAQTDDGFSVVGPKRFTNAKKKETGEHFAPLDPAIVEKPVPVAPVREKVENPEPTQAALPRGVFQRKAAEQPAEIPVDTKFKFGGGEGPKRFTGGSKISFKREEEKDDHVAMQLQKEREMEEKLLREKEEAAKQRENREKKHHKEGTSAEHPQGHDERKRFTNPKKEGDKPHGTNAEKPQPVPEVVENNEPKQPKESVEMHGSLSNKAWGDGPILKKKK